MNTMTIAICTYNGAKRLPRLVAALRQQECAIPFEILVVDNNSADDTQRVLKQLSANDGATLRIVIEKQQGITYARNRAIEESLNRTYLAFIDDDEIPGPYWLQAAVDALDREGTECVGGEIRIRFPVDNHPRWLTPELMGFLGQVQYGVTPFWIRDYSKPIWSGNIAYQTSIFEEGLRFDHRYNRKGLGVGGGSDSIMLYNLLEKECRIRYRPDMMIEHCVGPEKLLRRYFLQLHFRAGRKFGQYETDEYKNNVMGVPPFMLTQVLRHWGKVVLMLLRHKPNILRQAMNGAYAMGMIVGRLQRWCNLNTKK